jgi:hypothetical protein
MEPCQKLSVKAHAGDKCWGINMRTFIAGTTTIDVIAHIGPDNLNSTDWCLAALKDQSRLQMRLSNHWSSVMAADLWPSMPWRHGRLISARSGLLISA